MKKQLAILLVVFTFICMVSPCVSAIGLGVDCLVEDENGNDIIEDNTWILDSDQVEFRLFFISTYAYPVQVNMSITTSMTVDPDSWELLTARTYKHSFISIEMIVTPTANSVITIRWEWMNETEYNWDFYRFSVQYLPESVGIVRLRIEDASENEIHPGSLFEIPRGVTQTYLKLWFSSSGIDQWVMFSVIVNSDHFKIRLPEQSSDWQNEVSQDILDMSLKETAFVHLDILVEQPGNTTLTVHWSQVDVGGNQWTHNPPYTININALGGEPQIPGFPLKAILIGLFIAFMAVIVIRRRRTHVIND